MSSKSQLIGALDIVEKQLHTHELRANRNEYFLKVWVRRHVLYFVAGAIPLAFLCYKNRTLNKLARSSLRFARVATLKQIMRWVI